MSQSMSFGFFGVLACTALLLFTPFMASAGINELGQSQNPADSVSGHVSEANTTSIRPPAGSGQHPALEMSPGALLTSFCKNCTAAPQEIGTDASLKVLGPDISSHNTTDAPANAADDARFDITSLPAELWLLITAFVGLAGVARLSDGS
jgi:hypothetical protein